MTTALVRRSRPRRRGYSDVPHGLWTLVELSAAARLILGWLHSHDAGYLQTVTVNRIRREFGTSSVQKYLAEMEDAGYVEVERRGNGQAASIVLMMDPWEALFTPPPQDVPSRDRTGSDDGNRAETGSVPSRDRTGDRAETGSVTEPRSARVEDQGEHQGEDQERTSASPSSTGPSDTERFEKFWQLYPRRGGKPAAKRAFKGALKRSGLPAIQEGFVRWSAFWRINGTPEEFIPYPATWLNQERYNDPTPQVTSEQGALDVAKALFDQYQAEEAVAAT